MTDDLVPRTEFEIHRRLLDERYATQTKAVDAAFDAQQKAMATAFAAADRAVQAALDAADKANDKANTANDKRFDTVNEFRSQLNDIMTTLISRGEADARFMALDEKVSGIQRALDRSGSAGEAKTSTTQQNWGYLVGAVGILSVLITLFLNMKP